MDSAVEGDGIGEGLMGEMMGFEIVPDDFDYAALNFIDRRTRMNDGAADVANHPNFVDADFVVLCDAYFGDLCEMAAVTEVKRDAHRGVLREFAIAPA